MIDLLTEIVHTLTIHTSLQCMIYYDVAEYLSWLTLCNVPNQLQ